MKKKTAVILAGALLTAGLVTGAAANSLITDIKAQLREDFTIKVDGETKVFRNVNGDKVYPILYDGTTYLPVRAIGELMGKTVYWYEKDKRIELREVTTTVTDADVIITDADARDKDKKDKEAKDDADNVKKDKDTERPAKEEDLNAVAQLIGAEKAKEIALKKAGLTEEGVIFKKVELDRDDGIAVYEVEFKKGNIEYEAEINAANGEIVHFEKDTDD